MGALASTRRLNKRREIETDAISITQEENMNAVGIDRSEERRVGKEC